MANSTTSGGCFIRYMSGLANNIIPKSEIPMRVHNNRPCLSALFPAATLPAPSASATKGVMAVEKPIPKDMAMNTKLLPKETAANSAVPNCPTIILSANCTKECPSIPRITGKERDRL